MKSIVNNMPPASEQPWRERNGHVVLLAYRRKGDEHLHFPPLPPTSPYFGDCEIVEIDSTPTLYSFTVVHASPKANLPPAPLGYADFAEAVRVFGRLLFPAGRRPVIGEQLRVCVTQGESGPIYAFAPFTQKSAA